MALTRIIPVLGVIRFHYNLFTVSDTCYHKPYHLSTSSSTFSAAILPSKHSICITFMQCWTNVKDVEPTLHKCCLYVLCLLGYHHLSSFTQLNKWHIHELF